MEITKLKLEVVQLYIADSYPKSGFYYVNDENNVNSFLMVDKGLVSFIGNDLPSFIEKETEEKLESLNTGLSETFALKMLAIVTGGETVKKELFKE